MNDAKAPYRRGPVSQPALAIRAPAELVAHSDEPPSSIRVAAQATLPPSSTRIPVAKPVAPAPETDEVAPD